MVRWPGTGRVRVRATSSCLGDRSRTDSACVCVYVWVETTLPTQEVTCLRLGEMCHTHTQPNQGVPSAIWVCFRFLLLSFSFSLTLSPSSLSLFQTLRLSSPCRSIPPTHSEIWQHRLQQCHTFLIPCPLFCCCLPVSSRIFQQFCRYFM